MPAEMKSMSDMLTQPANAPAPVAADAIAAVAAKAHGADDEPEFRIRPITVVEYNRMAEAGIIEPGERVELVDGLLIVPPPHNPPHLSTLLRMQVRLIKRFEERVLLSQQLPIIVSDLSEPEPDFALLRWRDDFYAAAIPTDADAFAIVEVADTSLRMDRGRKRTVYARAGIPEYWIANVRAKQIEVHRLPQGDAYAEQHIAKKGDTVVFAAFPDVRLHRRRAARMSSAPTSSDADTTRQPGDHAGAVKSVGDTIAQATSGPGMRRITVAEYNRMAEVGILQADERVELVDGRLIVPPPMGDAHWDAVARMQRRIGLALGERALVTSQLPAIVSDVSEPEPDVMLIRPRDGFYGHGVPHASDVLAVIEVSDSSLRFDRREKLSMYARAGVPEYWIANLRAEQIEIYRDPHGGRYAEQHVAKKGDTVAFAAFPDVVFTVAELLG